jgi:nucleoside-diphosphate-sugar epimerase
MRIVIIGGTGFIGTHVTRYLLEAGQSIGMLHRGETGSQMSGVEHIFGDHNNLAACREKLGRTAIDVVLDMISFTERDASNLMQTIRGLCERVVAISSIDVYAAYGRLLGIELTHPENTKLTEDSALRTKLFPFRGSAPDSDHMLYNYEKILVERVVMNDAEVAGTVLRLPAVYGPGDKQRRLREYLEVMKGKSVIKLSKRKAQWRWTRGYVENVAAAIAVAVTDDRARNRIYNVGESATLTEADWVRAIGRAANWSGRVVTTPKPHEEHLKQSLEVDSSRIRRELGVVDPVSFDEGLKRTIEWELQAREY